MRGSSLPLQWKLSSREIYYILISQNCSVTNQTSTKTLGRCSFEVAVKYSNYLFEFQFMFTRFPTITYSKKIWIFLVKTIQSCSSISLIYILLHNMLNFHLHNCVTSSNIMDWYQGLMLNSHEMNGFWESKDIQWLYRIPGRNIFQLD